MDVTPNEESGRFPARVELGEPFKVTAQVFIEGRTKVGATAIVRNHRGKEMQRLPMTCTNPGLDRWEVMLTCGEHSDVKRGSRIRRHQAPAGRMERHRRRMGGHLQVLAA